MRRSLQAGPLLASVGLLCAGAAIGSPTLEWSDGYDGGGHGLDVGNAAVCDPDGNLIVAGESADLFAGTDMLIRKLDRDDGHPIWTRRYAAFDGNDMALTGMIWDGSGDLLVAGYIRGCVG
jgi:hypothetical protein